MVYRTADASPASALDEARRGRRVGRFCHGCGSIYPLYLAVHRGKPAYGKDHVSSPCVHEGEPFDDGDDWWEPAVETLPPPPEPDEPEATPS